MERKMVERRQALMGSSLGAQPLPPREEGDPLVKGLAPRLDGKQDDENDGEKSTVCNKSIYFHAQ